MSGSHFRSPRNRTPHLCQGENSSFRRLAGAASPSCQSFCGPSAYACAPATDGGGIANRLMRSRIAANCAPEAWAKTTPGADRGPTLPCPAGDSGFQHLERFIIRGDVPVRLNYRRIGAGIGCLAENSARLAGRSNGDGNRRRRASRKRELPPMPRTSFLEMMPRSTAQIRPSREKVLYNHGAGGGI